MLEADDLCTLLDSLRPPAGYQLDRAVGTTYSLDLYALMTAPLAFALFDAETSADDGATDIAALLEAIRRYSERIDVFCQAGQIALPANYRPIVAYLEGCVHGVATRARNRVFHPKVWVLRFVSSSGPAMVRLLVLSRNLTFDSSRDSVLRLDGLVGRRRAEVRERNAPLARFVRELPRLAVHPLDPEKRAEIDSVANELLQVDFELPPNFHDLHFWPLGIGRGSVWPFSGREAERKIVVSPFLSATTLARLGTAGSLVSRAESLDAIDADRLSTFGQAFVLTDEVAGDVPDAVSSKPTVEETIAEAPGSSLRGLHAKVFVFDSGRNAHVFTGSANATNAAFGGNVEFLVELVGARKRCGVDALLDGTGGVGFGELLEPYDPEAAGAKDVDDALEAALDQLRRAIAVLPFDAIADDPGDEQYQLTLRAAGESPLTVDGVARCWPITLGRAAGVPLERVWQGGAHWKVSTEGLTAFFAIELELKEARKRARVDFVVRASLMGAPNDRLDQLLVRLLRTRGDVLRYMLFLLAGDDHALASLRGVSGEIEAGRGDGAVAGTLDLPLVEWLVRAVSRSPERIDHLARLITSLRATSEGRELLPVGFEDVWDAVWEARGSAR